MKFYELTPEKRRLWLKQQGIELDEIDQQTLHALNQLSENVVGQLSLPVGLVKNLRVNDHSYLVPLVTEEPSVVAAANHGASLFAQSGGVTARSFRNGIYGQIVLEISEAFIIDNLKNDLPNLIAKTNKQFASLVKHGGGVKEVKIKRQNTLLYLRVLINPAEAMGANRANSILEYMASELANYSGIKKKLFAILSNYPSQLTSCKAKLHVSLVGGAEVATRIALLSQIGQTDPYRAVTNNKGIMNGIDGVLLASGNDTRAVEAACGVWASRQGTYRSLSSWQVEGENLLGQLTVPLALGTVGGSINSRKDVQQNYRILGQGITSQVLANIIAAVGLANNLAALLAIATTGIQAGHMKLQARNVIANLVASPQEKRDVLALMTKQHLYSQTDAQNFLKQLREEK